MCFEKYQGAWEVSPSYGSEQAYLFWKSVIDDYMGTNNKYEDEFRACLTGRRRMDRLPAR